MIILDTNVISELIRRAPSPTVFKNVGSFPSDDLYTTVIAEAEIRLGLAILAGGRKRTELQIQVDLILKEDFAGEFCLSIRKRRMHTRNWSRFGARWAGRSRFSMLKSQQSSKAAGLFLSPGMPRISKAARLR